MWFFPSSASLLGAVPYFVGTTLIEHVFAFCDKNTPPSPYIESYSKYKYRTQNVKESILFELGKKEDM